MRRAEEEEKRRIEEQRRAAEEDRQRRDREERQRREKEEEERLKREKLEAEERQREEIERKARDERERLARDAEEQERQRKKQALLAKLSAIDDEKKGGTNNPNVLGSPSRTRKDWRFTDPVENMHSGKPAYDLVSSSPKRKNKLLDNDDDEFSYKPSFGASTKPGPKTSNRGKSLFNEDSPKRNDKKNDLMSSLFGGDNVRKPTPPNKRENSGLDFSNMNSDSASKNRGRQQQQQREHSSTQLFGGGSAIVDDEAPPSTNNRLLPRRTSQQSTTFTTRPTVNEIDDIDDIEEVVL